MRWLTSEWKRAPYFQTNSFSIAMEITLNTNFKMVYFLNFFGMILNVYSASQQPPNYPKPSQSNVENQTVVVRKSIQPASITGMSWVPILTTQLIWQHLGFLILDTLPTLCPRSVPYIYTFFLPFPRFIQIGLSPKQGRPQNSHLSLPSNRLDSVFSFRYLARFFTRTRIAKDLLHKCPSGNQTWQWKSPLYGGLQMGKFSNEMGDVALPRSWRPA